MIHLIVLSIIQIFKQSLFLPTGPGVHTNYATETCKYTADTITNIAKENMQTQLQKLQ